ncbi:MAG: cytochrome c [Deltaproteobacteria bacterium]|nr:MAG: cytochrome c [Deltaproteobacteria bacterium]
MNRHRLVVLALVAAVSALGLSAWAAEGGKKMDGRALYKEYCKPCHTANSPNGEYTPMTLIQDQWQEFFEETYADSHPQLTDPRHGGKKLEELITPEMLEKIKKFAIDHAADSEHPMTCG